MKQLILALTLVASAATEGLAQEIGLMERTIIAPHHAKEMQIAIMYPAAGQTQTTFAENGVFYGTPVFQDASPVSGQHPVVVLSHGWGGNYARMAWLSAGLVSRGAIVVAVNHPNSSTFDLDFETAFDHWTRAQDISVALDHVLQDTAFTSAIDPTRIYATGFSYGGWTALSLAGVQGSRPGFANYCVAAGAASQLCTELAAKGIDINAIDQTQYEGSYKDPRISAVAAIDPGLTWGLGPAHVQDLTAPVLLIGLGNGPDRLHATDTSPAGSNFEAVVPQASVLTIAPAMHFSALGLCKPAGEAILLEEKDDPVCTDPEGTDRRLVLDAMIDAIAGHFDLK